jgi:hypothetical protein
MGGVDGIRGCGWAGGGIESKKHNEVLARAYTSTKEGGGRGHYSHCTLPGVVKPSLLAKLRDGV